MPSTFSLAVDPVRHLVRITMAGFFTPVDLTRFAEGLEETHRQLACGPHRHLTLLDMRDMHIQSQDTVESFRKMLSNPKYISRRFAIVVSRSLARMQIERAAEGREVTYFVDDVGSAERWLLSEPSAERRLPFPPPSQVPVRISATGC